MDKRAYGVVALLFIAVVLIWREFTAPGPTEADRRSSEQLRQEMQSLKDWCRERDRKGLSCWN